MIAACKVAEMRRVRMEVSGHTVDSSLKNFVSQEDGAELTMLVQEAVDRRNYWQQKFEEMETRKGALHRNKWCLEI